MSAPARKKPQPTRARLQTWCAVKGCEQWVGVTFNRFNDQNPAPKTLNHRRQDGSPCGNGRMAIHPNTVVEVRPSPKEEHVNGS